MPRQSTEGDRPSGLKFTRNNYYGFQREQDTTADRKQGSSLFSSYSKYSDNNSNITSNSNSDNYSNNNKSTYSSGLLSRPSMETSERPILPSAKQSISGSLDRKPVIASPTLPTRSPQRVRDSQNSQSFYGATESLSPGYTNSRVYQPTSSVHNKDYYPPVSSSSSPTPSQNDSLTPLTSSFTLSSAGDYHGSSSVTSLSTSPPPSRPRLSEARFSLATEVAKMWRSQSAPFPSAPDDTACNNKSAIMIESNDLLNELLVSRAVLDARDFKMLSFEELDKMNQEYDRVKQQVEHSASRLALEIKLRETARSLAYLNDSRSGHSFVQHQQEIKALDQKVDEFTRQHQSLKAKEHDIHCRLLEHMAGVLSISIRQLDSDREQQLQILSTSPLSTTSSTALREQQQQDTKYSPDGSANTIPLSVHESLITQLNKKEETIKTQQHEIQTLKSASHHEANSKEYNALKAKQEESQATLDHLLRQLNTTMKLYLQKEDEHHIDISDDKNDGDNAIDVLAKLDTVLAAQRSRMTQLEREIESILEKQRLEAMAEKKIEIQLRATQERRDAAETKCKDLMRELEQVKSGKRSPMAELDRLKADIDNFSFNDNSTDSEKISELESQLHQSEEQRQKLEKEVSNLRNKVTDMEVEASKIHAEMTSTKQREVADQLELQHYREEAFALRQEKNKWERMMKRQTVIQLMNEGESGSSIKDKYEQQLEEQEQEYVAQLKEQKAYLDKTTREKESLALERDQLAATCHDLEELIRGKTRLLDARDIHVSELEAQLQELRRQSQQNRGGNGSVDALVLRELQDAFSQKELAWMEQSANMEANFEGILKEFDRLTGTAVEFESDRMNYERKIEELQQRMAVMDGELVALRVNKLGYEEGSMDTPTTASLRKEFRRLVNDMKLEHQRLLDREANETKRVEKQLKDLKHEMAMANYEKINKGVQTLFVK